MHKLNFLPVNYSIYVRTLCLKFLWLCKADPKHNAYFSLTAGDNDFNSSIKAVKFNEGESEVSSCITLYDDQLLEGDEVFSVLLNIPDVTKREPGVIILSTVTIEGMHLLCVCTYVWMYAQYCMYESCTVCTI